jgi:glycerophosphoryl diester phosphodiesterase
MLRYLNRVIPLAAGVALLTCGIVCAEAKPVSRAAKVKPKTALPIVIGHRGASGYRPEHTLAAYELAIEMGADFVEPDLVSTKDGVLVARHENEISGTTDVANHPEFAHLQKTKTIDGAPITGWFTEDFTLAELKTLRAKERIPQLRPGNTAYDGQFEIPTLQEIIDLVARKNRELRRAKGSSKTKRQIGIYPETKHPTYFDSIGLSMEEPLVKTLHRNGYRTKKDLVFIQSFEVANLKDLNRMTNLRIAQLINSSGKPYDFVMSGDARNYADLITPTGLAEIAKYADGIGANKALIIPRDNTNSQLPATTLIADAHAAGLDVHAWTFRSENLFLPSEYRNGANPIDHGNAEAEYRDFYALGLDGVFSDHPDAAVAARTNFFD